jgi:hypothetical protein
MPPKGSTKGAQQKPLAPIPALQTKGWTGDMVQGIMYGIVYAGRSQAEAAIACGVDPSTVSRNTYRMERHLDRFLEQRTASREHTPERETDKEEPPTLAKAVEALMLQKEEDGKWRHENARSIRAALLALNDDSAYHVSLRTIQRRLTDLGASWCRRPRTVALNEARKQKRVVVAQDLLLLEAETPGYFDRIVFSDESYFRATDTNTHAWRRPGEERKDMQPRRENHWSAKIHVWGAIGIGFKQLVILHTNVNSDVYIKVLEKALFDPEQTDFLKEKRILMQDGAAPHTAKATKKYISERGVELLPWAPYSPDWNPIEHLWGTLKRAMDCTCFDDREELLAELISAWDNVEQSSIDRACRSFGARLQTCIDRAGEDCTI